MEKMLAQSSPLQRATVGHELEERVVLRYESNGHGKIDFSAALD